MTTEQRAKTQVVTQEESVLEKAIAQTKFDIKVADTGQDLTITAEYIRDYLAKPTAKGHKPTDRDIEMFGNLCVARGLNPMDGDAILTGYDSRDYGPQFSIVTTHQAFMKRLQMEDGYKGKQSGVILIQSEDGSRVEIEGDCYDDEQFKLIGGWCRIFMEGKEPEYKTANFKSYDKGKAYWKTDPGWMICKCAESKCARGACPASLGSLHTEEEMGRVVLGEILDSDETLGKATFREPTTTQKPKNSRRSKVNIPAAFDADEFDADEFAKAIRSHFQNLNTLEGVKLKKQYFKGKSKDPHKSEKYQIIDEECDKRLEDIVQQMEPLPLPRSEPVADEFGALLDQATVMFAKAETEDDVKAIAEAFNHAEIAMDIGLMADDARKRINKNG